MSRDGHGTETNGRRRSRCARSRSTSGASTRSRTSRSSVHAGEVTCVLGDNGAGKSTLIKILSGVFTPDQGELLIDGEPVTFTARARRGRRDRDGLPGPGDRAADVGVAELLPRHRADEGPGPAPAGSTSRGQADQREEMPKMGIDVRDPNQTVGTLSGGERQAVAIARAVYFGARVLILDEPTSALGVRQSGIVLEYVAPGPRARTSA